MIVAAVFGVEVLNQAGAEENEFVFFVEGLGGIGRIGEESEIEVAIDIAEVADFESANEVLDLGFGNEQGGNGDDRGAFIGNALGKIEAWNAARRKQEHEELVNGFGGGLAGGEQEEQA